MSELQRLRERLHHNISGQNHDCDDTADTSDIKLQESTKTTSDMLDNTGHSVDVTDHKLWKQKIEENGNKPEDWLQITNFIKSTVSHSSEKTYICYICMWYAKAINAINVDKHRDSAAYAQLLINFANIKRSLSVEESRNLLHFARKNLKKQAIVHVAAAQLEVTSGNVAKAYHILKKGKEVKAAPEYLIRSAIQNRHAGKPVLCENQNDSPLSANKENIEQPVDLKQNTADTTPVENVSVVAEREIHLMSHRSNALKLGKPEVASVNSQTIQKPSADLSSDNVSLTSGRTGHVLPLDSPLMPTLSNVMPKLDAKKSCYSVSAPEQSKDEAGMPTFPVSMQQSLSSMHTGTSIISMNGRASEESNITNRRSRKSFRVTPGSTEMDDADSTPLPRNPDSGVHQRTLKSYDSAPCCKDSGLFAYSSARKPAVLGKARRVKRTSMPDPSDAMLLMDSDTSNMKLDPLTELGALNMVVTQEKENLPVQCKDSSTSNQKMQERPECLDQVHSNKLCSDDVEEEGSEDSHRQEGDSGIITGSPELVLSNTSRTGNQTIIDKSVASTESSTKHSNVAYSTTLGISHSSHSSSQHSEPVAVSTGGIIHSGVAPSVASSAGAGSSANAASLFNCHSSTGACPAVFQPTRNRPKETLTVCGKVYTVIRILGRGGSSEVYDTIDPSYNLCAVKCVNFSGAEEAMVKSYMNEIKLLKHLQHSNKVIKLFDYEYVDSEEMLYVVMERGDTDLATLFKKCSKDGGLDTLMQKFYWKEMLKAVQVLHNEGIVHADLKPANFLLVAGNLKLIDFGIAKALHHDKTSVTCEQAVGTLNYMSPEAIMDSCGGANMDPNQHVVSKIKIGVKSDVWSLGCILYNMIYGKSPFHHINNSIFKLQAITNPRVEISFPETADPLLRKVCMKCLQRDPKLRPSINELLTVNY